MKKIFGFSHLRVPPPPPAHVYGPITADTTDAAYATKPLLYAVLQFPRTQSVHVVTYEDTPEGRSALAAQCRVERLIKLILGHHVQVESGNQISFVSGDGRHNDYRRSESV